MKKIEKVRGNFNIRAKTDNALREYCQRHEFPMSLVVDIAIVKYLKSLKIEEKENV